MNSILWILMVAGMGSSSAFAPVADFKTEVACKENARVINQTRGNAMFASCVPISDKVYLVWRP